MPPRVPDLFPGRSAPVGVHAARELPLSSGEGAAGVLAHLSQVVRLLTVRTGGGQAPEYHRTVAEVVTGPDSASRPANRGGLMGQAIGVVRF